MTKIRYVGPFEAAYFDSPRHGGFTVERDSVVDVPDPELVASLLEQPSNWQLVDEKPKPTTAAAKAVEETK